MKRAGTVLAKGCQVLGGGVALVLGQAILRVDDVPFFHAGVAVGFGEDRRGGDGDAAGVAVDEGLLLDEDVELHGVEEEIVGSDGEQLEGGGHGLAAGLVDIPSIDALGVDFGNGPGDGVFADARGQLGATIGREFFGVVEADDAALGIEDYGSGDYRAEEGAAAGFVEAGDAHPALLACGALEAGTALTSHRGDSSMEAMGGGESARVLWIKKTDARPVFSLQLWGGAVEWLS